MGKLYVDGTEIQVLQSSVGVLKENVQNQLWNTYRCYKNKYNSGGTYITADIYYLCF